MKIELNDKAIYDEMRALTGLRLAVRSDSAQGRCLLLTADMLPGLRNMIRLMFAETVLELTPMVEGCEMDAEDTEATHPYDADSGTLQLQLQTAEEHPSGLALAAKRQCEHIVAAKVLEALATDRDNSFATMLHREHTAAIEALRGVLESAGSAGGARIEPRWY